MSVEFDCKGHTYRADKLSAMKQFHVVRRMGEVLASLTGLLDSGLKAGLKPGMNPENVLRDMGTAGLEKALAPLAKGLAEMEDADAEYVIHTCLAAVSRKQKGGGWAKVCADERIMFEDIDMAAMLTLTARVLKENLKGFFAALPEGITGAART